ncbi:hypothetical protein [Azospirillum sp. A39]|uniref:hypothetical protein n=1 Tax=Azospirillum sp. A39 TaxID=3462279 RepID=UPI00404550AD
MTDIGGHDRETTGTPASFDGPAIARAPAGRPCPCGDAAICNAIFTARRLGRSSRDLETRALLLRVERWLLAQTAAVTVAAE